MGERVRLYVRYVSASVRSQMQYRASFIVMATGHALRWLAPAAGVLFLGVSLVAWSVGVRHYRSTGS